MIAGWGMFGYKEKRYGKFLFIIISLLLVAAGGGAIFGGVYAIMNMSHWAKYVVSVLAFVLGGLIALFGLFMFVFSFSLINTWKSVRDGNKSIGTANQNLCEKCGLVIPKNAEFCEHCGAKQTQTRNAKICPTCKTKNNPSAQFCHKCGTKFEE